MRTTITLDPDVAKMLKQTVKDRDITFKDAVNEAIRTGLTAPAAKRPARFKQRTFALGTGKGVRWDKALNMAAQLEDEEIVRKVALRK